MIKLTQTDLINMITGHCINNPAMATVRGRLDTYFRQSGKQPKPMHDMAETELVLFYRWLKGEL